MWPGIASRGPDGRGHLLAPGVALLHARLAIIDLTTGHQPVWNEARSVGCVFNGEIYNYRRLRQDLQERGHVLSTASDTEVLVHLYEEHGAELVHHVRGMYAFAMWDSQRRRLLLARDRRGIKPLYIADLPGGGLAFASTIASLLRVGISHDHDPAAIAEYFRFGKVGEPSTAYRHIRTLLPGTTLTVDLSSGRREQQSFYRFPSVSLCSKGDELEANARRAFEAAVASHMVADVEVGAFLSGGIDSSLVVAQAQLLSARPLRTFAVGFAAADTYNETRFAEKVAARIGTRHTTLELSSPPRELLNRALAAVHQPFAIASFLPLLLLSERAAQDVKVVLTGDGGDEVGYGYNWYNWAARIRRLPRPFGASFAAGVLRHAELLAATKKMTAMRRAAKFARGALLGGPEASNAWRYELTQGDALRLLAEPHRELAMGQAHRSPSEVAWNHDLPDHEAMRRVDLEVLLRDEMLPKLDRAGMAHGLEGRVPLLDDDFVEAMLAVPSAVHRGGRRGKALLRRWATELCPDIDVERPKHGFDVPIGDWLEATLYPEARRLLLERTTPGLVDVAAARHAWQHMKSGIPGAAHAVFALLTAELWFESRNGIM